MKFKINRNLLLENLNNVSKALSTRNIIPILNGIKFNLTKEGLFLTATDNEIVIESFIDKKDIKLIKEEGALVIHGRYILDIVRKLPDEEIDIEESDGNKVIIFTDNSKYNLNCFNLNDFTNITFNDSENNINILTLEFKNIINEVIFACSTQESRPLLTGVNIKIIGNFLECTATDSYRLAKRIYNLNDIIKENINIVIPSRNISEFVKLLTKEDINVNIHLFNNKIIFKYDNMIYQSSLLNGTYPNTDNSIPNEFEIEYEISLNDLYNAVDRASLLTSSKEKNIIEFVSNEDVITIMSMSQEIGKVEEKLKGNKLKGNNIKISFSAKYMLEALKTFDSEKLKLLLNGEIKPIVIKSEEKPDLIQLILPIKTF